MNASDKELIREYFSCVAQLQDRNIVRSDKILGDLGEWICVKQYGLKLEENGRNPGFDGKINGEKVQVKVHNSPKGTNMSVGNPDQYEHLIVLIGPKSRLRIGNRDNSFHIYRFTSNEVKAQMSRQTGYYCAKSILEKCNYELAEF